MRAMRATAAAVILLGTSISAQAAAAETSTVAQTAVSDETALREAFADPDVTEIILAADIELADCEAGQLDSPTDLIVEGAGHTIAQTCDGDRVMAVAGAITVEDVTLTGGSPPDSGGAIAASGDVTVSGSVLHDNIAGGTGAAGGAIAAANVTVTNSNLERNEARNSGGAIAATNVTVTDSTLEANTADIASGGVIAATNVTITDSNLQANTAGAFGGAIVTGTGGVVTITGSTLEANIAGFGGAIVANTNLTVSGSTLRGNSAAINGGAIFAQANVTVIDSTLDANSAAINGGAISANADVTVTSASLNDNSAGINGAISSGGDVALTNTTVTGNHADLGGGGVGTEGSLTLLHATVAGNEAPVVANLTAHSLTSFGSVVALPVAGMNCSVGDIVVSEGHNFTDDDSCELTDATDIAGGDPGLEDLADNGGPTQTRLPVTGGELFEVPIPASDCRADVVDDQRGVARPQGDGCTIGSVEVDQEIADGHTTVGDETQLREAVTDPTVTEILLAADIALTDCEIGQLDSATALTVDGAGHTINQTCDGERIIEVTGAFTIEDITLTGGSTSASGGAASASGDVTVSGSTLKGNTAGLNGGAIFALGGVTVSDSTVKGNTASYGGAILSAADVTVNDSTVKRNHAASFAGAIFASGEVTLTGSTMKSNGAAGFGGAVSALEDVTITSSTVKRNSSASSGGSIWSLGEVTVTNSNVAGNNGVFGGAVFAQQDVTVSHSTLQGNTGSDGGAILSPRNVTVTGSTLEGNTSGGGGGAISAGGDVALTNVTVTGNQADLGGGGVSTEAGLTLLHATVVGNEAPTGANVTADGLVSFGSVVALPGEGSSCSVGADVVSEGYNFSDDDSCGFSGATDTIGGDPGLAELADNGGPTETRLPVTGGELFEVPIPRSDCRVDVVVDQRDVERPQGDGCTIGSVEVEQLVSGNTLIDDEDDVNRRSIISPLPYR